MTPTYVIYFIHILYIIYILHLACLCVTSFYVTLAGLFKRPWFGTSRYEWSASNRERRATTFGSLLEEEEGARDVSAIRVIRGIFLLFIFCRFNHEKLCYLSLSVILNL